MVSLTEAEAAASAEDDPAELFLADQRNRAIHKALSQLEPQQRELLRMVYEEGRSCASIARDEGVNPRTVRERLCRAQEKLKKIFK